MISWTDLLNAKNPPVNPWRYSVHEGGPVVIWNITSRCNLQCQHCYFDAQQAHDHQELSYQEARDFIADLSLLKVAALLFGSFAK